MIRFFFFLLLLPVCVFAQQVGEVVFRVKKPIQRIYLLANFNRNGLIDTAVNYADTLISNVQYSFTIIGLDSGNIARVEFTNGYTQLLKGEKNNTPLYLTPQNSYYKRKDFRDITSHLAVYKKGDTATMPCIVNSFTIKPSIRKRGPGKFWIHLFGPRKEKIRTAGRKRKNSGQDYFTSNPAFSNSFQKSG